MTSCLSLRDGKLEDKEEGRSEAYTLVRRESPYKEKEVKNGTVRANL